LRVKMIIFQISPKYVDTSAVYSIEGVYIYMCVCAYIHIYIQDHLQYLTLLVELSQLRERYQD